MICCIIIKSRTHRQPRWRLNQLSLSSKCCLVAFYTESFIFILQVAVLGSLLGFKINVDINVKHIYTCGFTCILCMHICFSCPSCPLIWLANEVLLAEYLDLERMAWLLLSIVENLPGSILLLTTLIMHEHLSFSVSLYIYNIQCANVVLMFLIYDWALLVRNRLLYKVRETVLVPRRENVV